jgi:ADP-ribosylglycohydrolase
MEPADLYGNVTWLLRNPKMYHLRAPGNTCLSALIGNEDTVVPDYIASPRNGSKGCGGVMRVAPVALMPYNEPIKKIDMEAAQVAAITHGNSLGYMPAALLVHIIRRIVYPEQTMTLKEIVLEGCDTIYRLFRADANVDRMVSIIQDAVRLSHSSVVTDLEAIHKLGEGWVGEEALAIAVFCALKYENDFSQALVAAVNHGGDSDSTGAICGNILGAVVGYDGIGEEWKEHLELRDDILKLADEIILI